MLLTILMGLDMVGPGRGGGMDMHDGPPPEFLRWAYEQKKLLKQRRRTVAVEQAPPEEELLETMPDIPTLIDGELLEKLLRHYERQRHEQEVVFLMMED